MFRFESGLQANCSSCLRLNDLVWLQGHWNWRCAILGSILASNGRNAQCVVYNFLMRRSEIFDSELAPGSWSREFHTPALSVKPLFNIHCHDMWTPRRQWSALYEKEQRAVAPALIFCYLWGDPVEKNIMWLNWNSVFCHWLSSFPATGWFMWIVGTFLPCSCLPKEQGFNQ